MAGLTSLSYNLDPLMYGTSTFEGYKSHCQFHGLDILFHRATFADLTSLDSIEFKNAGKKLVRVTYKGEKHYLEPGDTVRFYGILMTGTLPEVVSLNNGLGG